MSNKFKKGGKILFALQSYITFFLLVAFITTCCMLVFLHVMQSSMNISLTRADIRTAAVLTFGNVMLLSLLCTAVDAVRRRLTVERPVRRIVAGAEKVMQGDFSVRIKPIYGIESTSGFDRIIDCFNRMVKELSGLETLRADFIANVSHELKTPLAVIQNYGRLLQTPDLPREQQMEYAAAITEAARRLADLVTNILRLNRLENQQIYPAAQRFDLGGQLAACLLDFESEWERKEIEIETDLPDGLYIESDEELLSLVWHNLISNALKFTDPHGKVCVCLTCRGEFAEVRVSDTGCGIPPDVGRHIFEKFYQGDRSHSAQGNGLGLALVKRVTDIVGGSVSVESEVGKGSTFTVTLRRTKNANIQTDS